MEFKVEKIHGKTYDCECCGSYSSEGICIYVNSHMIWEKYSDGHMYGRQTEESILDSVINAWIDYNLSSLKESHTEKSRINWNKQNPGNGIARTPESWKKYCDEKVQYIEDSKKQIIENCKLLPYDEVLQLKIIAIWIEECTGQVINVTEALISDPENNERYEDDFD